uniref:Uncharacterized protein n=1 Tax=Ciona savignyi TaxID=51511 RepID=H2YK08_CIOSA
MSHGEVLVKYRGPILPYMRSARIPIPRREARAAVRRPAQEHNQPSGSRNVVVNRHT